jgi:hypothetical protein
MRRSGVLAIKPTVAAPGTMAGGTAAAPGAVGNLAAGGRYPHGEQAVTMA